MMSVALGWGPYSQDETRSRAAATRLLPKGSGPVAIEVENAAGSIGRHG